MEKLHVYDIWSEPRTLWVDQEVSLKYGSRRVYGYIESIKLTDQTANVTIKTIRGDRYKRYLCTLGKTWNVNDT